MERGGADCGSQYRSVYIHVCVGVFSPLWQLSPEIHTFCRTTDLQEHSQCHNKLWERNSEGKMEEEKRNGREGREGRERREEKRS